MKIGFPGLLALIFITLKLTSVIDWSWWWVLSPLWISFVLIVIFGFIVALSETPSQKLRRELGLK